MKEAEFEILYKNYKDGNSTLKEEQLLFNHAKNSEPSLEAWSTFVKNNKTKAPKDFNNVLWQSFQAKKKRKQKGIIRALFTAASVILLISFFIGKRGQKEQSYAEKEVLLNQALGMFDSFEQKEIRHNIFYENEMIIVYTTTE
jgi:hypothetical protein